MTFHRITALTVAALLLGASCGGSNDASSDEESAEEPTTTSTVAEPETTTTEATTTSTEAVTTTTTEATTTEATTGADALPDTPAVASFNQAYTFQQGIPDPDTLPAQVGTVEARWYRIPDGFAVVYAGLDATVDACPGNSALTGNGFEFVSNAPLPAGACDDFPTRIDNSPAQGVVICNGVVGYLTLIPSGTVGTFFASIEKPDPDVIGVGITSMVTISDPASIPEIDPSVLSC